MVRYMLSILKSAIPLYPVIIVLASPFGYAREPFRADGPIETREILKRNQLIDYCWEVVPHTTGKLHNSLNNYGQFTDAMYTPNYHDEMTGKYFLGTRYPSQSNHSYTMYGELWIGAIAGRDTLVSTSYGTYYNAEFTPLPCPQGGFRKRSIEKMSRYYSKEAHAEQEYEAVFTDAVEITGDEYWLSEPDYIEQRPHKPIGLQITQKSYSWSYDYCDDFIIVEYNIKNISQDYLRNAYIGLRGSPYISNIRSSPYLPYDGGGDEFVGMLNTAPSAYPCTGFLDTLDLLYTVDNDAYPNESGNYSIQSPRGACGIIILRAPGDSIKPNFNWWVSNWADLSRDWGPRKRGTHGNPFRDMNGYFGTPLGDRNLYYTMSNGEFDYDQITAYVDHSAEGYLPPPSLAFEVARGDYVDFLISLGPYDLIPGSSLPLAFAVVCGNNVHKEENDFNKYCRPRDPYEFYHKLDFSELTRNAVWASWVYDNPGYDTDGDGYLGKSRVCCLDSILLENGTYECTKNREIYYCGDGVTDIRGAAPPPAPEIRLAGGADNYMAGYFKIRWNGLYSETTLDPFSSEYDFEGYRVYYSLSPSEDEFVVTTSFDKEDYIRWEWDNDYGDWVNDASPLSIDSLRILYGGEFDPFDFTRESPLNFPADDGNISSFYFQPQDWNESNLLDTNAIHKVYPTQPYPSALNLDTARLYYPEELTEEGNLKYFEYEYTLRNLLRSQMYYVSVTAFDYGAPGLGLQALETDPTVNMVNAYAQSTAREVESNLDRIIVYPNPYRIDGNYRADGFEGRGRPDLPDFRVRALHFINLPHRCTIRIFTIDGDLVRTIEHDYPIDDPNAAHDSWDLITRNTQAPVSGIYYYSVESEYGNEVGKFVLIM